MAVDNAPVPIGSVLLSRASGWAYLGPRGRCVSYWAINVNPRRKLCTRIVCKRWPFMNTTAIKPEIQSNEDLFWGIEGGVGHKTRALLSIVSVVEQTIP
jgi:hypothetical protein